MVNSVTFAIGDIHGCFDKLESLIAACELLSEGDNARFYADQKLLRGAFVTEVLYKWHPPKAQLVVLADSQYRSDVKIGLPALPRGV
jgi:hypothetical protein